MKRSDGRIPQRDGRIEQVGRAGQNLDRLQLQFARDTMRGGQSRAVSRNTRMRPGIPNCLATAVLAPLALKPRPHLAAHRRNRRRSAPSRSMESPLLPASREADLPAPAANGTTPPRASAQFGGGPRREAGLAACWRSGWPRETTPPTPGRDRASLADSLPDQASRRPRPRPVLRIYTGIPIPATSFVRGV